MNRYIDNLKKLGLVSVLLALVTACGGGGSSSGGNMAPRLGVINDTTVSANENSAPITVTVIDNQAQAATVTAVSADQAVVPDAGLIIGGGAQGNFSLQVQPTADTLGSTTITVTATDSAGLSAQTSFVVTVERQQVDFASSFRATFAADPSDQPADLNSREFNDSGGDDYADLLN